MQRENKARKMKFDKVVKEINEHLNKNLLQIIHKVLAEQSDLGQYTVSICSIITCGTNINKYPTLLLLLKAFVLDIN